MGTGTRMDRWRLRASNRDRVSALMRDAASRAAAVGESRAWAQANPNEVTRGSEEKAMINATQQIVNTAEYANADFSNAVIRQNQTEHENARERQLMWNQNNYRAGKENANAAARDAELKNTQLWVDEKYIQGKLNQNELNTRNDRKTTELYAREDYATSRANQPDVAISNETTKMYADKFSRLSMKDVMRELANSVDTTSGEDHTERFIAASEALIRSGQADKVRSIISGDNSEFASAGANFSSLVKGKENFRNRVAQVLGSSGEFTFQEYAKHLGQEGGTAKSFQEWADGTDEKSLAASIKAKGLDRMDKDGFEYLSKHTAALNAADVENISKVAASTTDAATVAKFVQAIEKLDQSKREKIIEHTSADRAANMDQSIRDALAGAKLERRNKEGVVIQSAATANDSLWQKQIGEAIRNNPQIAARFSKENRKRYAPSEETFSDGGGI